MATRKSGGHSSSSRRRVQGTDDRLARCTGLILHTQTGASTCATTKRSLPHHLPGRPSRNVGTPPILLSRKSLSFWQGFPRNAVRRRDGPPGRLYKFAGLREIPISAARLFRVLLLPLLYPT